MERCYECEPAGDICPDEKIYEGFQAYTLNHRMFLFSSTSSFQIWADPVQSFEGRVAVYLETEGHQKDETERASGFNQQEDVSEASQICCL